MTQLFEDGISSAGPAKRPAVRVAGRDEVVDALHESFEAGEGSAPNGFVGDQREEALSLMGP
ncbi:MAG: hypothetical protein H5U26_02065 [Immundisolibacter sp.]|nr:hypothetical protein [Immundisolibacter sp.]